MSKINPFYLPCYFSLFSTPQPPHPAAAVRGNNTSVLLNDMFELKTKQNNKGDPVKSEVIFYVHRIKQNLSIKYYHQRTSSLSHPL